MLVALLCIRRHEYDGHDELACAQSFEQGDTIHVGHLNVGDHAGNAGQRGALQQCGSAAAEFDGEIEGTQQLPRRLPDRRVIINHCCQLPDRHACSSNAMLRCRPPAQASVACVKVTSTLRAAQSYAGIA